MNWHCHVNWLNTSFIIFLPWIGVVSACWVPLMFKTLVLAIVFMVLSAISITAGRPSYVSLLYRRPLTLAGYTRIPPSLVSPFLQGQRPFEGLPSSFRCSFLYRLCSVLDPRT
jgi:hypothetical protein